mmetsp:Transcript_6821/g.14237  ORF Transcript_6821/g.14237 Transcript_6821/m.14237 type:complete len:351 (-) Transcript_6821:112-1164(-)|eukprot:CAMPEP_0172456740 /NCGR_PEP_ID=MMETSP1065-20121228/17452_1 /TAXON_ID=265537 /ORGANISM="Amphiprora paludosa, Strain CCMP125" /LENGTH=350 /DNA_ID=CAMNT_0013209957 /DNA_START=65 /DNA_END=1117 /DNA_ORIENTATION=-
MVVSSDRSRRRNSTGPNGSGPVRSNSTKRMDGFGDIATRRRGSAGGRAEGGAFDPFDSGSKTERKKSSSNDGFGSSDPFDPFAIETTAIEKVMQKKKTQQAAPKQRRPPPRSASIGTISKSDLEDFKKKSEVSKDSDLQFDDVDWDGAAAARFQSRPRARPKSTSRRHSMDCVPAKSSKAPGVETVRENNDGFGEPVKASGAPRMRGRGGEDHHHHQHRRTKQPGKSRRQSLDSALAQHEDDDADGFGPVKKYGYGDQSVNSGSAGSHGDRARRGSVGRTRSQEGNAIKNWKHSQGSSTRRMVPRRRSADTSKSAKQTSDPSYEYETETTVTNTTSTSAESDAPFRVDNV